MILIAALALSIVCESGLAKKMSPKKGAWLNLQTNGILFGTIAIAVNEVDGAKANVTYFIRRKDGEGKPEKLVSKKGLFAFTLEPGLYEIYDWSMSGSKGRVSRDRYAFEIRAGHLTYIGRIVTDVVLVENAAGKKVPQNQPYVTDERNFDATLFAEIYPVLTELGAILAVRNHFVWR